jgi:hypothetical protein
MGSAQKPTKSPNLAYPLSHQKSHEFGKDDCSSQAPACASSLGSPGLVLALGLTQRRFKPVD